MAATPSQVQGDVQANLRALRERIVRACEASRRDPATVRLVAVSKTFPADAVRAAADAGQRDFGENYLQEALDKIAVLDDPGLTWHFIGPIQSNKTRPIAQHFQWVHSVERLKIAQRLSEQRDAHLPPLEICLQVNVSGESSKSGVAPGELPTLAAAVAALPRLRLRGLMAIPEPTSDAALQRSRFAQLRELARGVQSALPGAQLDTLSMGMTADLEAAIAEGATIIRVGTAIFGARG